MALAKSERVLKDLHAAGLSVLGPSVEGLVPAKDAPTPHLESLQQQFFRPAGTVGAAAPCAGRMLLSVVAAGGVGTGLPQAVPVQMDFRLVQAPAAYSLPVMQKRPFELPFQVCASWRSSLPLTLSAAVAAYAVGEEALHRIADWAPPGGGDGGGDGAPAVRSRALLDGSAERVVVLERSPSDAGCSGPSRQVPPPPVFEARALISLPKLRFGEPSAMQPRWLVFSCPTPDGGLAYCLFRLPTIVMCRYGDQMERARRLLWGESNPLEGELEGLDFHAFRHSVRRDMAAAGVVREPNADDLRYLAGVAGFLVGPDGSVGRHSADRACLQDFRPWFLQQLATLRAVRTQYERAAPRVLCGFAVTREAAEAALEPQPRGAFLLRFTTSGAGLALSLSRGGGGGGVEHWQLLRAELERRGLEALVARVAARAGCPLLLLDLQTGQLHDRQAVLPPPLPLSPGGSGSGGSTGACKRPRGGRASADSTLSGPGVASSPSSGAAGPAGPLAGLLSPALDLALGSPLPAPLAQAQAQAQAQGWQPQLPADAAACAAAGSSPVGPLSYQQQQQLALQGWAPCAHPAQQQQQQQPHVVPMLACVPVLSSALAGAARDPAVQAQLAQAPHHQPCYVAYALPPAAAAAATPLPVSQLPGAAAAATCGPAPPPPPPGLQSVPLATSVLAMPMVPLLQPHELVCSAACAIVNATPGDTQPRAAFGAGAAPAPPSRLPPQQAQLPEQPQLRRQGLVAAPGIVGGAGDPAAPPPLGAPCLPPAAAEPLAWLGAEGGAGGGGGGEPPAGLDLLQLDDCSLGGPLLSLPPELFVDGDALLLFGGEPS